MEGPGQDPRTEDESRHGGFRYWFLPKDVNENVQSMGTFDFRYGGEKCARGGTGSVMVVLCGVT